MSRPVGRAAVSGAPEAETGRGGGLRLAVAFLLLWTAGCGARAPESDTDRASPLTGCWRLEVAAEGIPDDSVKEVLSPAAMPPVLELDTTRIESDATAEAESYAAYSWFDGRRETEPFSVWHAMDGDSIRVQRVGALSGLQLRLKLTDDRLAGNVVSFTDVLAPGQPSHGEAPVTATRVPCPE